MKLRLILCVSLAAAMAGCDTLHGPGVEYTAPKVSGQLIDDKTGEAVVNARVGRRSELLRPPVGVWRKGGEDLVQQHEFVRTDAQGQFELPSERAILLFRFGDTPLNLDLATQHRKYGRAETNLPYSGLRTNVTSGELEVAPVEWRIAPR
ncbi:MAG TPA: hypothetical protein VMF06_05905 [Candidatus Limnocylindria bacterium]|nr:hypothetical protein [Candidatus Limnocylindria bacterium]